jgi:hypothetical protein
VSAVGTLSSAAKSGQRLTGNWRQQACSLIRPNLRRFSDSLVFFSHIT